MGKRVCAGVHGGSRRDSRSQTAAWRGQRLAQVRGSVILDPIEGQIEDVQRGVPPQHLGQMISTIAAQSVTTGVQKSDVEKPAVMFLDLEAVFVRTSAGPGSAGCG